MTSPGRFLTLKNVKAARSALKDTGVLLIEDGYDRSVCRDITSWIDDHRDDNDDRDVERNYARSELRIWEAIARAYVSFCSTRELPLVQKKEVFEIVLIRSMFSEEEALQQVDLKFLSREDAKQVMQGYYLDPAPIIAE